jgi:(p)ppGpp synthase/HD superfamily hydrolase
VVHPVAVAVILGRLQMDCDTVVAGLLHDTVEDTPLAFEDLEAQFGATVRKLVEGETKVSGADSAAV